MSSKSRENRPLRLLWTRPECRGVDLLGKLDQAGIYVKRFSVIEIVDSISDAPLLKVIESIERYDMCIFVSVTAVERVVEYIKSNRIPNPVFPDIAVIGAGTERACLDNGWSVRYRPAVRINSEGLLQALEKVDVGNKRIALFRGQLGRDLLESELQGRGAQVEAIECYRRTISSKSFRPIIREWQAHGFDVVFVTSVLGFEGLLQLLGDSHQALLKQTAIVTISDRIAEVCQQSGFQRVVVTAAPDSESVMTCFDTCFDKMCR